MGSPTCIGEQASGNMEVDCRELGALMPVAGMRSIACGQQSDDTIGRDIQCQLLQVEHSTCTQFIHAYKASPNMTLGKEVPSRMWPVPLSKWSRFCALGTLESSIAAVSRFGGPAAAAKSLLPLSHNPPPSVLRLSRDRECCVFHNLLSLPPNPDTNLTATACLSALRALQQTLVLHHITPQAQHIQSASQTTNH
jgi:hypothetical protein